MTHVTLIDHRKNYNSYSEKTCDRKFTKMIRSEVMNKSMESTFARNGLPLSVFDVIKLKMFSNETKVQYREFPVVQKFSRLLEIFRNKFVQTNRY